MGIRSPGVRIADHQLQRRILELEIEQRVKHGAEALITEVDEIPHIQRLAREAFGDLASIHVDRNDPGVFQVGYFTAPAPPGIRGDGQRPRAVVFRARTAAELAAQIAIWRFHR